MTDREGHAPHRPDQPAARPGLGALLGAAVRDEALDPDAEKRALVAFRAARDAGAHRVAPTRRRDDWRPAGERRREWPVRATLVALAASLTLGGVAVAAIGSGVGRHDGDDVRDQPGPRPSSSATAGPGGRVGPSGPAGPSAPAAPERTGDTVAHCRAYDSVKDSVKKADEALDPAAWRRLIRAAGGEENVGAYCAALSAGSGPGPGSGAKEKKEKKNENENENENEKKENEKKDTGKIKPSKPAKVSKTPGGGATKKAQSTKRAKSGKSAASGKSAKSKGD